MCMCTCVCTCVLQAQLCSQQKKRKSSNKEGNKLLFCRKINFFLGPQIGFIAIITQREMQKYPDMLADKSAHVETDGRRCSNFHFRSIQHTFKYLCSNKVWLKSANNFCDDYMRLRMQTMIISHRFHKANIRFNQLHMKPVLRKRGRCASCFECLILNDNKALPLWGVKPTIPMGLRAPR